MRLLIKPMIKITNLIDTRKNEIEEIMQISHLNIFENHSGQTNKDSLKVKLILY